MRALAPIRFFSLVSLLSAALAAACNGAGDAVPEPRALPVAAVAAASTRPSVDGSGWIVVDLTRRQTLAAEHADWIDTPALPGSLMKIVTLVAASEAGMVSPSTTLICRRHLRVDDRELDCVHPEMNRPLSAAEALALSCNDFFAQLAGRLTIGS